MNQLNSKVDAFLRRTKTWKNEFVLLREIVLECGLTEEYKWRQPCYTFEGKNIVILSGFKKYFALSFFKGALLKDDHGILVQPTKNMQSGRQIRFADIDEIARMKPILNTYIRLAIDVEKKGLKVRFKDIEEFDLPHELQEKLDEDSNFKTAFDALTPGRQRGYILHFSQPKQSKSRHSRIVKCTPLILAGKGLHDDYQMKKKQSPKLKR